MSKSYFIEINDSVHLKCGSTLVKWINKAFRVRQITYLNFGLIVFVIHHRLIKPWTNRNNIFYTTPTRKIHRSLFNNKAEQIVVVKKFIVDVVFFLNFD